MKHLFFILLSCTFTLSFGQEKELNTKITGVTVYLNGAHIIRTGTFTIPAGKNTLIIKNLSPYINENSIQVNATGDFTIVSVNHRVNYLEELIQPEELYALNKKIESLQHQIDLENTKLEVNKDMLDMLNKNKKLGDESSGTDINQLRSAMSYYEEQLSRIRKNDLEVQQKIKDLTKEKEKYQNQLSKPYSEKEKPTGEIVIRVEADQSSNGEFSVSYVTDKAGWFPRYDIRATNVSSPVILSYKARVYQNTGVDWNNVKLVLSNTNPSQSGVAPELETWQLNFARYTTVRNQAGVRQIREVRGRVTNSEDGSPLPGVNVFIEGTSLGTISDGEGYYSLAVPSSGQRLVFSYVGMTQQTLPINSAVMNVNMTPDIMELQEVVVTKRALQGRVAGVAMDRNAESRPKAVQPVQTVMVENQTSVNFEIEKPYTVKSQDESLNVDIHRYEIPAMYEYFAVPKLDKDAFLIARITGWDQYHLLEGEANLYFENTYIGKTILDVNILSDTLDLSLGRDKNVTISRERVDEYMKKRFLGANREETRGLRIQVRNNKSQPIHMILRDQVPVSVRSEITVDVPEISGASWNKDTGQLQWTFDLPPREQKELVFRYEVKYPKNEKVILE